MERGLNRRYICLLQLLGEVPRDNSEIYVCVYVHVGRVTDGDIILFCVCVLVKSRGGLQFFLCPQKVWFGIAV